MSLTEAYLLPRLYLFVLPSLRFYISMFVFKKYNRICLLGMGVAHTKDFFTL